MEARAEAVSSEGTGPMAREMDGGRWNASVVLSDPHLRPHLRRDELGTWVPAHEAYSHVGPAGELLA